MSRSYSDPSYGAKHSLDFGKQASIDGTYQSAVDLVRYTFMFPVKVTDWNLRWLTGGTDFGADSLLYLGKSAAGTGAVSVIGTAILGTTATQADGTVLDCSVDAETSFSSGDDIVLQGYGTVGLASIVAPVVQYVETFVESDS